MHDIAHYSATAGNPPLLQQRHQSDHLSAMINRPAKVCLAVVKRTANGPALLAFRHPLAGHQLIKGGIAQGEAISAAARRELFEESGVVGPPQFMNLGSAKIGTYDQVWTFLGCSGNGLPHKWVWRTRDDHGHQYSFFWQPLKVPLNHDWHSDFHAAHHAIQAGLACSSTGRLARARASRGPATS